jgi:gas vesicle protein
MTNDQKVILGIICGAALGAVAGILLAPESGEETRKRIASKAGDLKDDLTKNLNSTVSRLSSLATDTLSKVQNSSSELAKKAAESVNS